MTQSSSAMSRIDDVDVLLAIIDNLPTSIFVKNDSMQFELSNAAHCAMIGHPPADLIGYSDADFYPPDQAAGFLQRDRSVLESGETIESVEEATNKRGETTPVFTRKSKLVMPNGKTYLIGTNTDITELRKREEQYRALAQTVPVGVWQVGEDGASAFANPLFLAHTGLEAGTFGSHDVGAALGHPQLEFPGRAERFETDIGGRRLLIISSGWLRLGNTNTRSAIVSTVDITEMVELKRVNDEISRLNRELADNMAKLREAQDEIMRKGRLAQLGQLIATVAHEIRNPLGAVRTASFLIERKIKGKELGLEPQLLRIANGITRCDAIITQLLDFSRIKALNAETVEFDSWLAKLVEEEARGLPEVVAIQCELGLDGRTAEIDPTQLGRAIINLLYNASEAMVGKGDQPEKFACANPQITVSTRLGPRGIEVAVSDNGPGISKENIARILEPLFTTKSFGTGLGLPAVEKVAENHGGGLLVASEPGNGACFTLWFPSSRVNQEAA